MHTQTTRRLRRGFTLIELVVVVLVMGILAAVAAPRMFDTAATAKANSTRQSLVVVRDAIELYKAQNGAYPGELGSGTDLADDLKPFLKGPFPKATVPGPPSDASVKYITTGTGVPAPDDTKDWVYNNLDGTFGINAANFGDF